MNPCLKNGLKIIVKKFVITLRILLANNFAFLLFQGILVLTHF
jgi:hypothetical protein